MTHKYFLKINDERVLVCHDMFLSTLGLNEKMVYLWIKAAESGIPTNSADGRLVDKCKRVSSPAFKHARQYLTDLPKLPSHYCRASTTK